MQRQPWGGRGLFSIKPSPHSQGQEDTDAKLQSGLEGGRCQEHTSGVMVRGVGEEVKDAP